MRVNEELSDEKTQINGVPQGSVLSVTLFLICMNKVSANIRKPIYASLYADDLVIYCMGKDIKNTERLLQEAIIKLQNWTKLTGFKFSLEKTKILNFTRSRYDENPILKMNGSNINHTDSTKFLGMILDKKKLTWKKHILQLKSECLRRLNILKIREYIKKSYDVGCRQTNFT